jgi:hypothetical protein
MRQIALAALLCFGPGITLLGKLTAGCQSAGLVQAAPRGPRER